jgi:hypothetical protein
MARPIKEGLEYFPLNVDFFDDDKIQLIDAEFYEKGCLIVIKLMCKIYKENGYYYQWGDDQCLLFAKSAGTGIGPGLVKEVIAGLVRRSFFDKRVYDRFGILTSFGIQKRYFEATKKRQSVTVFEEFLVNVDINSINDNINLVNYCNNTQSKVKESKGKESKGFTHTDEEILKFTEFEIWLKKYAPRVQQMKQPLTIEEYFKLKKVLDGKVMKDLLFSMQNYVPLHKKSLSAYRTILKWSKNNFSNKKNDESPKMEDSDPETLKKLGLKE